MVFEQASGFFATSDSTFWKAVIVIASLLFIGLLITAILYPLLRRKPLDVSMQVHKKALPVLGLVTLPKYRKVAVAIDFSERDQNVLAHAIAQAGEGSTVVLIHIVESASAKILGVNSDDFETRGDQEKLDSYADQLKMQNVTAETHLGFRNRTKEIARLVKESNADLLIIGAHGHQGVRDWLYGETIDAVRHKLKIPVLIV
jgi:manganese transport protein